MYLIFIRIDPIIIAESEKYHYSQVGQNGKHEDKLDLKWTKITSKKSIYSLVILTNTAESHLKFVIYAGYHNVQKENM